MDVTRKDATITNTDDAFPGSFEVILSAPTKDRDGDTLLPEEWKQPLPDHITFDHDHGMSVASTVGSGVPSLDEKGRLIVSGTYSSLPRAQEVRTLVNEGHIKTTSVAFMSEKTQKDGKSTVVRELLNGAFVAVPSNREALVLSAKGVKSGARNSKSDQEHLDAIARHAIALGANPGTVPPAAGDSRSFTLNQAGLKDADTEDAADPAALLSATDAAIDEAIGLFASVDTTTLPAALQQAIALVQAADATVDELLDALGIPDPDEDADTAAEDAVPAAPAKAAPAATTPTVPVEDDSFDQLKAARLRFYSTLSERN